MDGEITIRALTSLEEMDRVEELQRIIWPGSEVDIVPVHLIKTIACNGGIVLGAFEGEDLRGYVFGFLGTTESGEGKPASERLKHCSHQLGVHPDHRNRHIGYRLKLAQRKAVVEQGLDLATWTYDPLLSLNGYFNVRQLGVVCHRYLRDAYGSMRDGLNVGLPSDRFDVDWWVDSSRVIERVEKRSRLPGLSDYQKQGAVVLNPTHGGEKGLIYPPDHFSSPENALALVEIPPDFLLLKDIDFELARAWKFHTREIFEGAFAAGYTVTDFLFIRDGEAPCSYYLLSRGAVFEGER